MPSRARPASFPVPLVPRTFPNIHRQNLTISSFCKYAMPNLPRPPCTKPSDSTPASAITSSFRVERPLRCSLQGADVQRHRSGSFHVASVSPQIARPVHLCRPDRFCVMPVSFLPPANCHILHSPTRSPYLPVFIPAVFTRSLRVIDQSFPCLFAPLARVQAFPTRRRGDAMDLFFIALGAAFFALTVAIGAAFERIRRRG